MSSEQVTAVCAVCVAVLALGVTLWQGYLTRKHNRLSVQPAVLMFLKADRTVAIELRNSGIGPAFLEAVEVAVDGEIVQAGEPIMWNEILEKCGLNVVDKGETVGLSQTRGIVLRAGEVLGLVAWESRDEPGEAYRKLDALNMRVRYRCIYGRAFVAAYHEDVPWPSGAPAG